MAAMKLLIVALVGTLHLSAAGLTNIEIHATAITNFRAVNHIVRPSCARSGYE